MSSTLEQVETLKKNLRLPLTKAAHDLTVHHSHTIVGKSSINVPSSTYRYSAYSHTMTGAG